MLLACQEADAWAEVGAQDFANAALRKAEAARQVAGVDPVGGLLSCSTLRQHNYSGAVELRIGNPASAINHATAALAAAKIEPTPAYGTVAQVRIWAAAAHLNLAADRQHGSNGVEGAEEFLRPVLALPPEQRLDTVVRRLRSVGRVISSNRDLQQSLPASYPGSHKRLGRWFVEAPLHDGEKTWVLSKMWGTNTEPVLDRLLTLAPADGYSYEAVADN